MNYSYGIWKKVLSNLKTDYDIINFNKYNQVTKNLSKNNILKDSIFIYLMFSEGDQKLQDYLHEEGYNLFPYTEFSKFIRNREVYLPEIDLMTKYSLKRVHLDNISSNILKEINTHFGDLPVVLKVGNLHASEGKWLINKDRILPALKYKMRKLPVTIEEFIPNARSIRIGLIGDANNFDNYFITEHVNSKTWLKNYNPEEEITYSYSDRYKLGIENIDDLISEVQSMALKYNANLLGSDWVINKERIGLLELNDMIGLPEGDFSLNLFTKGIEKILNNRRIEM